MTLHTVSVIVPCRNERAHIAAFLTGVQRQQLPRGWALQLLIADGMSDDGTRELLSSLGGGAELLDNPRRIVSAGLNIALDRARGEVIVRMDVHTDYADDYIAECLAALERSGADNVGGPWRATADPGQRTQCAIAAVFQSRWLAGGARSRQLDHSGWVDTVYLGCWPRRTFERFGDFDEELVRNQDDEHNLRIIVGGGRIWQSAAIRAAYRPRASIGALFRQYLQYGYWKPLVIKKHGRPASIRHVLPTLLILALAASSGAALLNVASWPILLLGGLYGGVILIASGLIAANSHWRLLPVLPIVITAYQCGYGIGGLLGWFDVLRGATSGRKRFARLTR